MDAWSPKQYEKFKQERTQPFHDLMKLVEARPNMKVVDLGCGTGELTRELHLKFKARETLGIDSSEAMLKNALKLSMPGLLFRQDQIEAVGDGEKYDLIFSNAALQWLPSHFELLGKLTRRLESGGQIAVQIPANQDHVSHTVATEVAAEMPFRDALNGYVRVSPVLKPEEYASLLFELGYFVQSVELKVYGHVLASREGVLEWVKGTLLTDYQKRLQPEVFESFVTVYAKRLAARLENETPYFYPFKRILLWGKRP